MGRGEDMAQATGAGGLADDEVRAGGEETAGSGAAAGGDGGARKSGGKGGAIWGIDRRDFCVAAVGVCGLAAIGGGIKVAGYESLVRPPGAQDEERFLTRCIRCQRCTTSCPHDIIVSTSIEHGVLNMRTPSLDFTESWCDWCAEANDGVPLCTLACPTDALELPEGATREDEVQGVPLLTTDWCLSYRLAGCKYCYEACEYGAIELDSGGRPHVIVDACVGCGACEAACVSLQDGSIEDGATHRAIIVLPPGEEGGEV